MYSKKPMLEMLIFDTFEIIEQLRQLADAFIGEQQVVIKALPDYIKKVNDVNGCSLLGYATISLILDISEVVNL